MHDPFSILLTRLLTEILPNKCHFCSPVILPCYCYCCIAASMAWCEKHHWAVFMIIRGKEFPATINVLYQVFSPYGEVEKMAQFWTMGNFLAGVNLYLHMDAVKAFCKLQDCQISDLDLYLASAVIGGCKPYIPKYMLKVYVGL